MKSYRRNLPHLLPDGAIYFVTFRLSGSIPADTLEALKEEQEKRGAELLSYKEYFVSGIAKYIYQGQIEMFYKYDAILDKCQSGNDWLKNREIAEIIKKKICFYDKKRYDLISYCIMPNHVHLLVRQYETKKEVVGSGPSRNYELTETLRYIKGGTAREANLQLKRTGEFWQHESYDHFVRDRNELATIIEYIERNPVKAGLAKNAEDWQWSYTVKDFSEIELPFM